MPYTIKRSDFENSPDIVVEDQTTAPVDTSIPLVGRNATDYGTAIATTQVHILENFANSVAPDKPIPGQLWYDNVNKTINVNTGDDDGANVWSTLATSGGDLSFGTVTADNFQGGIFEGDEFHGQDATFGRLGQNCIFTGSQFNGGNFTGVRCDMDEYHSSGTGDVAERFSADKAYTYGTIVKIGGSQEVTQTTESFCEDVFGVVSENPSIKLYSDAGNDETHPYIAFSGRVQVNVAGAVKKGKRIVSSATPGVAIQPTNEELDKMNSFNVIGRALETCTDLGITKVWVAVGAK